MLILRSGCSTKQPSHLLLRAMQCSSYALGNPLVLHVGNATRQRPCKGVGEPSFVETTPELLLITIALAQPRPKVEMRAKRICRLLKGSRVGVQRIEIVGRQKSKAINDLYLPKVLKANLP